MSGLLCSKDACAGPVTNKWAGAGWLSSGVLCSCDCVLCTIVSIDVLCSCDVSCDVLCCGDCAVCTIVSIDMLCSCDVSCDVLCCGDFAIESQYCIMGAILRYVYFPWLHAGTNYCCDACLSHLSEVILELFRLSFQCVYVLPSVA